MERRRFSPPTTAVAGSCLAFVAAVAAGAAGPPSPRPVALQAPDKERVGDHPYLLVTKGAYDRLQRRARKEPWKRMKREAVAYVRNHRYEPHHWSRMWRMVNKGALAYILDPENRPAYRKKIREALTHWSHYYENRSDYHGHNRVALGAAFMSSVLALDVVRDALDPGARAAIEKAMGKMARWYRKKGRWELNQYGCSGVWALYEGRFDAPAIKNYVRELRDVQIAPDGSFREGPTYAAARLGCHQPARQGKVALMHVLEGLGMYGFYSRPRYAAFYEWLFGHATTPFFDYWSFCDSTPSAFNHTRGLGLFTAYRFSERAARLAARINQGDPPPADLLHYVLMEQRLPEPGKPASRVYPQGGAWFVEPDPTAASLAGAMWNNTRVGDHSHMDINALHLAGYGKHLLRNVGYPGYPPPLEAEGNNVVLVDGENHNAIHKKDSKAVVAIRDEKAGGEVYAPPGGGVKADLTTRAVDYARGFSGKALRPQGEWWRNFCFVHPSEGAPGYFVVFDEVDAKDTSSAVNVVWHPNSDTLTDRVANKRYAFDIGDGVSLDVFLATPPAAVEIRSREGLSRSDFDGKYLYTTYPTAGDGRKTVATMLFPSDDAHPRPSVERRGGSRFAGAVVSHEDGPTDRVLASSRSGKVEVDGHTFRGRQAVVRTRRKGVAFYFVREATSFRRGGQGFSSESPVTLSLTEGKGKIVSPGTVVTFRRSGIEGVHVDGEPPAVRSREEDAVTVRVPEGKHTIALRR